MFTNLNEIKTLALFTNGFTRQLYIREVAKLLHLSPRTAMITLDNLEQQGLLKAHIKGKIKLFTLNPTEKTKHHLILAENYKRIQFLKTHTKIELLTTNGPTIIFGSYAKGTQDKDSDLDILAINSTPTLPNYYDLEAHIINYPRKIFEKTIHTDILLHQVLDNHVIMQGTDYFLTVVLKWLQSRGVENME